MLTSQALTATRLIGAIILAGLTAAAPVAGSSSTRAAEAVAASSAAGATVRIDNFTFAPATLTVPVGTTVTWVNADDLPHTIAAKDRRFKSKALDTDDTFAHTFSTPGRFEYFCSLHPHITGTIVVEPAAATPSS